MTDSAQDGGTPPDLDLFSISQKICSYSAPFLAIIEGGKGRIIQTNCHHWDCPRCGILRAKHEYGRIVNGAKTLSEVHSLYFYTFTCRGKSLSVYRAERNYLLWTNRLLSTMRARARTEGGHWDYVQVTERQKRGHPHSHLLMCWIPGDALRRVDSKGKPYIYSKWFLERHKASGLGTQARITPVESVEGTARYIAKYLFKDAMLTKMPANWHRVRYSQNFPQLDETELRQDVRYITIGKPAEWAQIAKESIRFEVASHSIFQIASMRVHNVDYAPVTIP